MSLKRVGVGLSVAALAISMPGTAAAEEAGLLPPDLGHVTTVPVDEGVAVNLTAPDFQACNAVMVLEGSHDELSASEEALGGAMEDPAWWDLYALLAYDPALLDTHTFGHINSDWVSPRTTVMDLPDGTYVVVGHCVPYDENGDHDGDEMGFSHEFTVGEGDGQVEDPGGPVDPTEPEDPAEPGNLPGGGIFGSLGTIFGS